MGKPVTMQYGKSRPIYLLLAGNDTVPSSVRRAGGVRCTEWRLVITAIDCLERLVYEVVNDIARMRR